MRLFHRPFVSIVSCVALLLSVAACGGESTKAPVVASVDVTPSTATLSPGQTSSFSATARDANGASISGQPVTWASSNSAVLSVSAVGVVTAVSDGLASVSATIGGRSGSATVQVRTPVASVVITPATTTVAPGVNASLSAVPRDANGNALSGRTVQWSSSNTLIATVSSSGVVTGVTEGSVTISASVDGQSGTAAVTVRTPISSIVMSPLSAQLFVGGAAVQLSASPRTGTGVVLTGRTLTWSSNNTSIAAVSQTGLVTAVAPGSAIVSATSEGVSGTTSVQVLVNPCNVIQPFVFGQTVTALLANTDCRLSDNTAFQRFEFTLTTRTKIEVLMSSSAVDSYVYLLNAAGDVIDEDDDSGGGANARLLRTLPAGRYFVLANTYNAGEVGAFQLAVRAAPAACVTGRAIVLPVSTNSTLQTTACRLNDDSYEDRYDLTIATRTNVRIAMSSTVIDPIVVVTDSIERVVAQDDDSGDGNNSFLEVVLEPGRYSILARGYPRQTGAYRLDIAPVIDPCLTIRNVVNGQVVNGTLAATDCAVSDGGGPRRFFQRFALTVDATSSFQFDMTSSALDAYLIIQNAQTGAVVGENDDANGSTTNSRIVVNLTAGQYIINATTYDAGQVGAYQLLINRISSGVFTMTATPTSVSLIPGQTQQATVAFTGTTNTAVAWSSSFANVASVSSTGLIRALTPGNANIIATSAADPTRTVTIPVSVGQSSTTTNLDIAAMYVVQVVQQLDGRIPLVSDRAAVVRVFARGSRTGIGNVPVRVRFFQGQTVVGTYQGTATATLSVDESCCSADIAVPGTMIRAGISILADVDPANLTTESNETDNQFPLSGTPQALLVTTAPPFNIRFVPVQQNRNGATAAASTTLMNTFRSMWPTNVVNQAVRQTLAIDYTIGTQTFDDWSRLVRDIELLRRAEGGNAYYYGLVRTTGTSGVLGLANGIPALSAIGVDEGSGFGAVESRLTFAHEMGHTLSLRHSPCGGAAGPEPTYPFPDGRTGVFGMDTFTGTGLSIKLPNASDVMTYCPNQWVSAFNYRKVMDFRLANPNGVALLAPTSVLMLTGAVLPNSVTLDAAFAMDASPDRADPNGTFVAEGLGADGRTLFSWRFTPYRVDDAQDGARAFVIAVPLSAKVQEQVARIVVRDGASGQTAARAKPRPATQQQGAGNAIATARSANGAVSVTWSVTDHPMLLVRDRASREIVAIGRTGSLTLPQSTTIDRVELLLSDGVSSTAYTVDPLTGAVRK